MRSQTEERGVAADLARQGLYQAELCPGSLQVSCNATTRFTEELGKDLGKLTVE
jgi:hypothetical protein